MRGSEMEKMSVKVYPPSDKFPFIPLFQRGTSEYNPKVSKINRCFPLLQTVCVSLAIVFTTNRVLAEEAGAQGMLTIEVVDQPGLLDYVNEYFYWIIIAVVLAWFFWRKWKYHREK
jgi:hypothetical protein